jgi:nucleoside-diphosphate-sugar epimerase
MSNPIGPNMSAALLGGTLARQIVEIERGKTPVLTLRDLRPLRDFISAHDCVRALWHLAEFGTPAAMYNVASGESISIAEVVKLFLDLARVRPIEVSARPTDDERSSVSEQWLSNARLRALGWQPEESLRQAISHQLDAERTRS